MRGSGQSGVRGKPRFCETKPGPGSGFRLPAGWLRLEVDRDPGFGDELAGSRRYVVFTGLFWDRCLIVARVGLETNSPGRQRACRLLLDALDSEDYSQ